MRVVLEKIQDGYRASGYDGNGLVLMHVAEAPTLMAALKELSEMDVATRNPIPLIEVEDVQG